MENRVKRIENCTICAKEYLTSKKYSYYCHSCDRNVKIKKVIRTKPCLNCNSNFDYNKKSAKYCSQKCANEFKNKSGIYLDFRRSSVENTLLSVLWGARSRSKRLGREFDISDKQILDLLLIQNYKCAMTGLEMKPSKQGGCKDKDPYTVSIDRKDNSKGYVIDNIQLVCTICNIFKNSYDMKDVANVCIKYIEYNNIKINV